MSGRMFAGNGGRRANTFRCTLSLHIGVPVSIGVLTFASWTRASAQICNVLIDSGLVSATGQGTTPVVVFSQEVRCRPGAPSVRLHYQQVQLSGSPATGNESYLRITSLQDGATQIQGSLALQQWNNSSAYFNGDTVRAELLAYPNTGDNRVVIDQILGGGSNSAVVIELVPDNPGPYVGGEALTVDVWLHSRISLNVILSLVQFDFSDADPQLSLDTTFTFDYSTASSGPGGYNNELTNRAMPFPRTGNPLACCPEDFILLPANGSLHIGSVGLRLPAEAGVYHLDTLNADEPTEWGVRGALIVARSAEVNDPYQDSWEAFEGELTFGAFNFVVGLPIPVPEGVVVELVPHNPGPYAGGETLTVHVWLHSVVSFDVWPRRVQFDFADTDPRLALDPTFAFDLSASARPMDFTISPELPVPWVWNYYEYGCDSCFLPLPARGSLHIGSIGVRLPTHPGVYRLDTLNADEPDPARGAALSSVWRAFTGEITWGSYDFMVVYAPPIPAISTWGLTVMTCLLLGVGCRMIRRRHQVP